MSEQAQDAIDTLVHWTDARLAMLNRLDYAIAVRALAKDMEVRLQAIGEGHRARYSGVYDDDFGQDL